MRIMITKSGSSDYWYDRMIGAQFDVLEVRSSSNCYIVKYDDIPDLVKVRLIPNDNPGIRIEDAVIVKEDIQETKNDLSLLFEQKVLQTRGFMKGDKVTYTKGNVKERGIVKSCNKEEETCFVVYHWADTPDEYEKFTGQLTNFYNLKLGWDDTI